MTRQEPAVRSESTSIPHWYDPSSDELTVTDGTGVRVWDEEGNEYLDFCSQLYCVNLGHDEETVIEAMDEQARQVPYVSSAKRTPVREELAEQLADIAPSDLSHTFLSVSGSEANEVAAQLERKLWEDKKHNINFSALVSSGEAEDDERNAWIDALVEQGYSHEGAKEVLEFAGAEVAKTELEE